MTKAKTKTYRFDPDGAATVLVGEGRAAVDFGEKRTYETDDVVEQAALDANPDVSEVKGKK